MQHDLIARRLVVVPYFYPPFPGAGNRWVSLSRHLRQAGYSVTIVATNAFGSLPDDDECGVIRVGDLRSSPTLRRILHRGPLTTHGKQLQAPPPAILTRVVVPDSHLVGWIPVALAKVRHLVRKDGVDCLITSSPPDSNHLIGLLMGAADLLGLPIFATVGSSSHYATHFRPIHSVHSIVGSRPGLRGGRM